MAASGRHLQLSNLTTHYPAKAPLPALVSAQHANPLKMAETSSSQTQRQFVFSQSIFTANRAASQRLAGIVRRHAFPKSTMRIMDIGCGTGDLLFELVRHFPTARFIGIDISRQNISACQSRCAVSEDGRRMRFLCADYLATALPACDVIIADSVLQNIQADRDLLFGKIAGELNSSGRLFLNLPHRCFYNRALWQLRSHLIDLRGKGTDRFIATMAQILHPKMPKAMIENRIIYMYLLPSLVYDSPLKSWLACQGLTLVLERKAPHTSPGQPKHTYSVWEKAAS